MDERVANTPSPGRYALGGKIMFSAIVILFLVVVLMVALHLYARWYLLRQRRRQLLRRRRTNSRRTHVVFYVDNTSTGSANNVPENRGLEPLVLGSLPVFVYSSKARPEGLECAVCLSEFEENEMGRVLPKCNHSFHIECIDMWFHSHSTCPICRAAVEPVVLPRNRAVVEPVLGSSSEEGGSSSMPAPLGCRRKGLDLTGVRIEIPIWGGLEDGPPLSSPASLVFRSPGSRLLSLKRILSMGRRTPTGSSAATPSGAGTSCLAASSGAELDLEGGPPELTRVLTPS